MADPFQDLNAADPAFVSRIVDILEARAKEPLMVEIIESYLEALPWVGIDLAVEVGCGTGPITRRMADHAARAGRGGQVEGLEPSSALVAAAIELGQGMDNLRFATADGTALPHEDGTVDVVVYHTVLTHVTDPVALLTEARRVLRPGGQLVVCDADFSKASFASGPDDPMGVFAQSFVRRFVTDAFTVGKLPAMVRLAGFETTRFDVSNRITTSDDGMIHYVQMCSEAMVSEGLIGQPLAEALLGEYARRRALGELYGFIPFATLIANKSDADSA
ncbi:methyltransferase domain-containing protein [Flavimaricola marinus]|uniref:Demethylmenaquinone methyltransferase n=1 Tax=Flavimaricola marinus TaxID=1819565 RepID=A0A238LES7_9RHOB|nr:methyltransferase domain-containing protein [Flavimaricola marinus]SMY07915.1 Demethylmenaquinone methyltransferase [Flavimaricola marinus]